MIITCEGCQTKYLLEDEKVPEEKVRVRCPKCKFVWQLIPPVHEMAFEVSSSEFASGVPEVDAPRGGWNSADVTAAAVEQPQAEPFAEEVEISCDSPAQPVEQIKESPELRKKKERARRQARVFVSDILVYNRDKRDKGLANGDLMTVLGSEIKKAWEAYKDKVGPDLVESSDYFREALNDILADGQKIF